MTWLRSRSGPRPVGLIISFGSIFAAIIASVWAGPPAISFIEPFLTNYVLIHFETEANRTYILQSANSLSVTSQWSNMFTGPALPFPDHYVVLDPRTNQQRFYRLSVRP